MSDYVHLGTQYGELVVGKAEAARQAQIRDIVSSQQYGRLVLGEEKAAELQQLLDQGEIKGDDLVQPPPATPEPETSGEMQPGDGVAEVPIEPPAPPTTPSYTLAQLSAILAEQPHTLEKLVEAEIARPDGPRKGAVAMFVQTAIEQGKTTDFVEALQALID